jgi:hypothetical protein
MEEVTEAVSNLNISEAHKKNRIQVSNTKKPLFFYVNLAKVSPLIPDPLVLLFCANLLGSDVLFVLSQLPPYFDGLLIACLLLFVKTEIHAAA